MAELKTRPNENSVADFLASVADDGRREDAQALCVLMARVTGEEPVMWGSAIVGFGSRHLKYASGRELDWPKTAFSPRKANLTVYLMEGFYKHTDALARLGKHTTAKSCLYIKRLTDVDLDVLAELISDSYANANT
ncbi:MAG: DUF1801 domain-containing protein [Actinomycetes bacterium]